MKESIQKSKENITLSKSNVKKSPYRPSYHFLAPAFWMNDPNGTIQVNGMYHLFYQYNPHKNRWGSIHWGHAISRDLVYWEHLPIALTPSKEKGEKHYFSGCCVIKDEIPHIIYTKIGRLTDVIKGAETWIAKGSQDLVSWNKYPENPIITDDIHRNQKVRHWRDPYIWKENDTWFCIQGGHFRFKRRGCVFLYKSLNLLDWDYIGVLYEGNKKQGWNFECPNFLKLKERNVLIVSPHNKVIYGLGDYQDYKFSPEFWHYIDHGSSFYATNTLKDDKDRWILFGWIKGGGNGWNGCICLPRILDLDPQGNLTMFPLPELNKLRTKHKEEKKRTLKSNETRIIDKTEESRIEIVAKVTLGDRTKFTFKLGGCKKKLSIGFDKGEGKIFANKEYGITKTIKGSEQEVQFHLFLDKSVFELFLNHKECITGHFYPKQGEKLSITINSENGDTFINSINIWKLKSIW